MLKTRPPTTMVSGDATNEWKNESLGSVRQGTVSGLGPGCVQIAFVPRNYFFNGEELVAVGAHLHRRSQFPRHGAGQEGDHHLQQHP